MQLLQSSQARLHFIVLLWGFTAVLGALIHLDALELVWYRMGIAVLSLWLYFSWKGTSLKTSFKSLILFLGAGAIIMVHWVTFFHAIKISTVSVTLACLSTAAFFTSILEPLFYRKRFEWTEMLLGLLAIGGILIIFQFETDYTMGIIVSLCSAFLAATFTVINGLFVKKHRSNLITFYELGGGWLLLGIYLLFAGNFNSGLPILKGYDLIWLILLATVCTAYAFIESVEVMRELNPFTVVLTINLEPIYGILLAWLILGQDEKMSGAFYIGASLILASVVANGILKRWRKRRSNKVELRQN